MTRWDPWRDLFVVPSEISQFLNQGSSGARPRETTPAVYLPLDIRQTEGEFVLEASVPGFSPEEIEVVSDQGTLTIRGERKAETKTEGRYLRRERRQLSFFRQIALPTEVRESEITATFVNGVLSVRIPRMEAPAPTRIKIQSGSESPTSDPAVATVAEGATSSV